MEQQELLVKRASLLRLGLSLAFFTLFTGKGFSAFFPRSKPLGKVVAVQVQNLPFSQKVLAVSLQGVVNQKRARIYLISGGAGENRPWEKSGEKEASLFWLKYYLEQGWIEMGDTLSLPEALQHFSKEVKGYILITQKEPWTLNAATTYAGLCRCLVVYEEDEALAKKAGIKRKMDLKGKWQSREEAVKAVWREVKGKVSQEALGIVSSKDFRIRDYLIQHKVFTFRAKAVKGQKELLKWVLERTPSPLPVLGYLSSTGVEEFNAVTMLSSYGKVLIPSDTTPNLSLHSAVRGRKVEKVARKRVPTCQRDKPKIVVAISDGDNLVLPITRYISKKFWLSPQRGQIPLGWSIGLSLAKLAPGAMHYYASTMGANNEIVPMMGIGYAYPSLLPEPAFFFQETDKVISAYSFRTLWHLDPHFLSPRGKIWKRIAHWVDPLPFVHFVGYAPLRPEAYLLTKKKALLVLNQANYEDTPAKLTEKIDRFLQASSKRKGTSWLFLGLSVWDYDVVKIQKVLSPYREKVQFLLPSQISSCFTL